MTPEEKNRLEILESIVGHLVKSDRLIISTLLQLLDGRNIQLGKTTGTKFGTESTQKAAFFGATPVVQASAIAAPSTPGATYSQSEAQSAVTAINSIRTAIKNFGITA